MELPLLGTYEPVGSEPVGSEPVGSGTLLVERSETLPTLIIVCNVLRDKRQCGGNPSRPRPEQLLRQGTSKEVPCQSLQTANKKYLGATRVAGIMALPAK